MIKKTLIVLSLFAWVILLVLLSSKNTFLKKDNRSSTPSKILPPVQTPTSLPFLFPTSISTSVPTSTLTPTPTIKVKSIFPNPLQTISIVGDENCKNRTTDALNLLEEKAPQHALVVKRYIGIIECVDQGSGMIAQESPPRFKVGLSTLNTDIIWYAGSIVHDSCHSKLYYDAIADHGNVYSNDWTGKDAESKCINTQYDAVEKIGASQETLDYLKKIIGTNYWETADRWW